MNTNDIHIIFQKAVQRYKYATENKKRCGGVKSFAVLGGVEEVRDIDTNNIAKTYQDYLSGLFWSHDWYYQGADKNKLSRQLPALVMCHTGISSINKNEHCNTYRIYITDMENCKTCPAECQTPIEQALPEITITLSKILKYVSMFKKFLITYNNGTTKEIWDAEEYLAQQVTLSKITAYEELTEDMICHAPQLFDRINIYPMPYSENHFGAYADITFCGCEATTLDFKTDVPTPNFVGSSFCVTC